MTLLSNPAVAALCAIFVWWFSTGIILYVVGLAPRTFRWSALAAFALFAASLWGLATSSSDPSVAGAYLAFIWALGLWGALEIGFLLGLLTGPRSDPCPDGCSGWRRVTYAIEAILYHELALIVSGAAVVAVTWDGANQIGLWTLAILWSMRLSAKLNLFLGVPILNDQFLPSHLSYLSSFFTRGRVNFLFPVAITGSTVVTAALVVRALAPDASAFDAIGFTLLATLMALAVVEHWFMVLPLPVELLWNWGMRSRATRVLTGIGPQTPETSQRPEQPQAHKNSQTQSRLTARQNLEDRIRQAFTNRSIGADVTQVRREPQRTPAANWRGQ
jgi:putative photosynthetic complex assembly protein 2